MSRIGKQQGRKYLGSIVVAWLALSAATTMALDAKEKDPRKIFKAMEDRDQGDKAVARLSMLLVDNSGRKRQRSLMSWRLKFNGGTKQLMIFESPADVRNTGLLSVDYDDPNKDDDHWLYLPALHRATRISGADRSGSFLGTDLSYADLTKRDVDAYDHKLITDSVKVDGEDCWLVESRPKTDKEKSETGYLKTRFWISKSKLIPLQVKAWVEKGQKLKYIKFTDLKNHDGVWLGHTTTVRTMKKDKVESTTIMKFTQVKFNDQSVNESMFSQRRMEQGL